MKISFSSNRLAAAGTSIVEANRLFGALIGRKYVQRVAIFRAAGKFTELFGHKALRLHPLKGKRAGQYAVTLTGNWRLVFEKMDEDEVRILSVEDYHGD